MEINECQELVQLLIQNHLTLATCESASCGELASLLGTVSGLSQVYKGGFVTYMTEMKHKLLKIDQAVIDQYGVVSEVVARLMAQNTSRLTGSDIAISITGNAGPSAMEDKPVGLYYIGLSIVDITSVYKVQLEDKGRDLNRTMISLKAISILKDHLVSLIKQ